MLVFIVMTVILLWFAMWKLQNLIDFRFTVPALFVLYMCGIYWAMYTPGIFSKSDVSGGVPNTIQQIFLLTSLANVTYVIGYIQRILREHVSIENLGKAWWGPVGNSNTTLSQKMKTTFVVGATCGMVWAGWMGYHQSTDKLCVDFVQSGRAGTVAKVWEEQSRILEDSDVKEAIIPELYGVDSYPICHMLAEADASYRLNQDMAAYYGKESVTGYDYKEWLAEIGCPENEDN